MKVTAYKAVDVECEVDVEIEDVIREFSQRADEATETYWRRIIPSLDWMTRILASVKDETIAAMPFAARSRRRGYGRDLTGVYDLEDVDELRFHAERYLGIRINWDNFTFSCSC